MQDFRDQLIFHSDDLYHPAYGMCKIVSIRKKDTGGDRFSRDYLTAERYDNKGSFDYNQAAIIEAQVIRVRSWVNLANEALGIQKEEYSLERVVNSFNLVIREVGERLYYENKVLGHKTISRHPICRIFIDRMMSLSGIPQDSTTTIDDYEWVERTAKGAV